MIRNTALNFEKIEHLLKENLFVTEEATLTNESKEESFFIANYVTKQLHDKTSCDVRATLFSGSAVDVATDSYFDILTRVGLSVSPSEL